MLKDRNQIQKNTVNTLQLKTTRNIAIVKHAEFITLSSKGTHTPWKCGMSQEKSIRKNSHKKKKKKEWTLMILVR